MLEMRKLPNRSVSLYERVNKSDAEDKSLSNDETPVPSCPRQPPDGVETPSDTVEKVSETPSRLTPRFPAGWPKTRTRFSYSSRTQDARSEASVKDKIAMFSNDSTSPLDRLDKCGTLPARNSITTRKSTASYTNSYTEVNSLDRRLTKSQDNLDEIPRLHKRHADRPEVVGSLVITTNTSNSGKAKNYTPVHLENKPLFYGSTTTLTSTLDTSFTQPVYHTRSVSDDNSNKSIHKSNLEYLIEQRKKSMSKLRGLVIPEAPSPIIDLPEIKVQDSLSKSFLLKTNPSNIYTNENKINISKSINLNETKWRAKILPNNIPKYSPAFKRKSLQVYTPFTLPIESTTDRKFIEKSNTFTKIDNNSSVPLKSSFDFKNGSDKTSTSTHIKSPVPSSNKVYKNVLNYVKDYKNLDIKICTATDIVDSDNDSAMSSTQSSYRSSASSPLHNLDSIESDNSRLSPRVSHYTSYSLVKTEIPTKSSIKEKNSEEYIKTNICRSMSSDTNVSLSSSAGSAATSGSQASCSSLESSVADSEKRKVSKTYNVDTINRRNILASAKCRSGRDTKLQSPLIETKFSHESCDQLSSSTIKTSDRLSTLTSSVSAITNKGENRRRNKIIAETDSDSDNEVNIRQRKTDFKVTRLKRSSSSANKNKQNETNLEAPKDEDAPKIISEKIIKEIKKAGLDNLHSTKIVTVSNKNNVEVKKTDNINVKNDEKNIELLSVSKKDIDIVDSKFLSKEKKLSILSNNKGVIDAKIEGVSIENSIPTHIIRLKRGAASGVGLILAGGIDCEAKDVTVHRVLADSIAAKAGLKRGAKIYRINGRTMTGLTHAQSVAILKEQCSEVVIEIENETRGNAKIECGSDNAESKVRHVAADKCNGSVVSVSLEKAGGGAGLGFGLDGGRDSPHGDRPLTIKKLFAGGAAAQSGRILVGAELLSAGGQSMEGFTRTQAWAALKALPTGPVTLVLRNPKGNEDP